VSKIQGTRQLTREKQPMREEAFRVRGMEKGSERG
jgi:hypothetical protein